VGRKMRRHFLKWFWYTFIVAFGEWRRVAFVSFCTATLMIGLLVGWLAGCLVYASLVASTVYLKRRRLSLGCQRDPGSWFDV